MTASLMTIATYSNPMDVALARARLEGDGIWCYVANEQASAVRAGGSLGMALQVRDVDAARALEILREPPSEAPPAPEDVEDGPRCPRCGGRYAYVEAVAWRWVLSWLTRGRVQRRTHLRCKKCGHAWTPPMETPAAGPYRG